MTCLPLRSAVCLVMIKKTRARHLSRRGHTMSTYPALGEMRTTSNDLEEDSRE